MLTAAHCVSGSGAGMVFAPGYHGKTDCDACPGTYQRANRFSEADP